MTTEYEMVVGLEVHVQLRTRTKAFCNCPTDFGAPPNANTCPVCLALPGALPVLNAQAVALAVRTAHALECTVHPTSIFARKNYFYPDLPKGYQISQFDRPLATSGRLAIGCERGGVPVTIGITRLHMEEDAGKSVHDRYAGVSAIDLNRSGVPLVEIVSEPEIRSSAEAGAYLRLLKQVLEYVDVSDVNMEEGSLRVDANVSARPFGETRLGTKTELKNLNSFSGVERALDAEFKRQVAVLHSGGRIEQQTMLWDAAREEVRPARAKEGSHDYRYFPEPDLPPLVLDPAWIAESLAGLPELPAAKRERFARDYGLGAYDVDVLIADSRVADYFEATVRVYGDAKTVANWITGEVLAELNASRRSIADLPIPPDALARVLALVRDGTISHSAGKKVFGIMAASGDAPDAVVEREALRQVGDDTVLFGWIDAVLAENPVEATRYAQGDKKLHGFLMGLVMKRSKGQADPKKVNQLLAARGGPA